MTPYIQQQLKKLCDNPNWYDDMLISWDKNPRNQREAIYNYLSHVQLNGLLENTQIVFTFIDGDMKPAFYFEIPRDTNRYLILGILDEAGYPHCCLLGQPKQMFNPQLSINIMKPTITINEYPIGWEWLDRVPLEDFNWLIEIFATLTDNTDTYNFVGYTDSETLPGHQKICSVDKIPLANFLNEDQGYQTGISMYGHYIACKCLDISSEEEYMNQFTDIRILTNEL